MRGYGGRHSAGLTLRPPSNCGHQTEAPAVGLFFCLVLGGIAEIVLHPPLHRAEKKKPHYQIDSGVFFLLAERESAKYTSNNIQVVSTSC